MGVRLGSCLILKKKDFNIENCTVELYDAKQGVLHLMLDPLENDDYVLRYKDKPLHRFTYPIYKKLFNADLDDSDEKHKVCNHTLRHSFATHAVMHNDIFLVQKLMNHKDINMTLRYAKADEEKKVVAVTKMF